MQWLDPRRKELNSQPAYGEPPLAVLPRLQMMPKSGDLTEVSAVLAIAQNTFSEFRAYCDTRQIPSLLYRYHDDPEEFLESFFGYKIPNGKAAVKTDALSKAAVKTDALSQDSLPKSFAKTKPAKSRSPELNLDDLL